jgi:hypothetical protein
MEGIYAYFYRDDMVVCAGFQVCKMCSRTDMPSVSLFAQTKRNKSRVHREDTGNEHAEKRQQCAQKKKDKKKTTKNNSQLALHRVFFPLDRGIHYINVPNEEMICRFFTFIAPRYTLVHIRG